MKYLKGKNKELAISFIKEAVEIAKQSSCQRDQCGSIIVKNSEIIGRGFNSPAGNNEKQRRCEINKNTYHSKVTDKMCCVHAEQRAIMDCLKNNSQKIIGSRLYFMRLDKNQDITKSGQPYCTICSKMALDTGIKEFVLWHDDGVCVYNTDEYNILSYKYNG